MSKNNTETDFVLFDTDFVIASLFCHQSMYKKAGEIYRQICYAEFYMLDVIAFELVTTISRKFSQEKAKDTLQNIKDTGIQFIKLSETEINDAWQEWLSYDRKHTSFFDCANLIIAKKMKYKIASFDTFYPEEIRVTI